MTREEVYNACMENIKASNFLILEATTGFGKSKISIDLVNHLSSTKYANKPTSMLLLVAKKVHKETWKNEFEKWGGINVDTLTVECYESLHKHEYESFDIIVMDEVHHIKSDKRLDVLKNITFGYFIGLSATIPKKLMSYFQYQYKAKTVSCDIVEAIEDEVLPEPQILLMPLQLDSIHPTETIEINPKAKGKVVYGTINDIWKLRKQKVHAIISCTEKQKVFEMNNQILREKNLYNRTRQDFIRNRWLFLCGQRLQYLAYLKNNVVNYILYKLAKERTITFCKTIEQSEYLGKFCIHSKNKDADDVYNNFNAKKINHITAVNILNENANLVDCKYAIFANLSSSEIVIPQRLGRAMRHKSPIIIVPYYTGTREEEIVEDMFKDYNKDFIKTIHSIDEI